MRHLQDIESFEEKISPEPNSGCWLWTGFEYGNGYGGVKRRPRVILAHRYAWELFVGEIPDSMNVLHRCDTPKCVNPQHLFLGTHLDNMRDCSLKKRTRSQKKTHCEAGHLLSVENLLNNPKIRICKACKKLAKKKHRLKRLRCD